MLEIFQGTISFGLEFFGGREKKALTKSGFEMQVDFKYEDRVAVNT